MFNENEFDRILDYVLMTSSIICCSCKKIDEEHNIDEYDAAELFKNKGWRVTKYSNCYCPDCSKKKLK